MSGLNKLWSRRELLWYWTKREVYVRYKQSFLGIAWAILQPVILTSIFTIVFAYFVQVDTGDVPYPIFAYTALVPWTFIATSIAQGTPSLVAQMNLITKASFPRVILPLGVVGAALVDFLFSFAVLIVLLILFGIPLTPYMFWTPLLIILQVCLAVGILLFSSAVNVFFRDIRFLVPLTIQVWMYASPIVYPIDLVPEWLLPIYSLNPMVGIIESYRAIFLHGSPPQWTALAIGGAVTMFLLVSGYIFFKKVEPSFADLI